MLVNRDSGFVKANQCFHCHKREVYASLLPRSNRLMKLEATPLRPPATVSPRPLSQAGMDLFYVFEKRLSGFYFFSCSSLGLLGDEGSDSTLVRLRLAPRNPARGATHLYITIVEHKQKRWMGHTMNMRDSQAQLTPFLGKCCLDATHHSIETNQEV
ncbi:hypothetical protein J6590_017105 [Homalodisca vitripennis]|nr:hypothetical protein J6590_017105 [Homalodisca vitripennis]